MPDINSLTSANTNGVANRSPPYIPWDQLTAEQRRERNRQNNEAHEAFFRLADRPIEPGFVLVMLELERLAKDNDRAKFKILHDWLVEKLGRTYHAVHIASGYATDEDEEFDEDYDPNTQFFKVRERYIDALNAHLLL